MKTFEEYLESKQDYPTISWIRRTLRYSSVAPLRKNILAAYIVGSEAKGTARPDSDLDIAVIIEPIRGKTALSFSDNYHSKFSSDNLKPRWNGRMVDFQFFYPNDPALGTYSKIPLLEGMQ